MVDRLLRQKNPFTRGKGSCCHTFDQLDHFTQFGAGHLFGDENNARALIIARPFFKPCHVMQKMLHEAKTAVDSLETAQIDNTAIERFNKNIERVQLLLRDKKYKAMDKLQTIIAVKERLTKQQDVFEMNFNRYGNSKGR